MQNQETPNSDTFVKLVVESFRKTLKEINPTTEELDARYRWLKYFVEQVLGYSGNDYHIEKKRADITIFDENKRPVIKIETKRAMPLNKEDVEKQALGYAESATNYIGATNFKKLWLWERKNGAFALTVDIDFEIILHTDRTKFNIEHISTKDRGDILYLGNLKKEYISSAENYKKFSEYYAQVDISQEQGFQELLNQLKRIVNEILMPVALRAFDKHCYAYNEYKSKVEQLNKRIKTTKKQQDIQALEREKERLKQEYTDFRDFGFDAWVLYSCRDPEKYDENKLVFCKETIYVLLNKLLFVRICEDKGLFKKKKISNGGIEQLREFIENTSDQYKQIMNLAFKDARHIYNHFYEPGVLDWYTSGDGELDRALNRVLWLLNQFNFNKVNRDLLGNLYEKYLPKDERKALGEFYTPIEIIQYILENTGYANDDDLINKDLIDASSGSGGFLVKATNIYIDRYIYKLGKNDRSKLNPKEAKEVLESAIQHIYGLDINPFACHIAEMNLLFQVIDLFEIIRKEYPEYKLPRFKIYQTDSLKLPSPQKELNGYTSGQFEQYAKEHKEIDEIKNKKFHYVVGNPPYVRVQFLPFETVSYWKENYKVAHKRVDIYVPFYERAVKFLESGGKLGFITSDQFLVREYGLELRRYLANETKLLQIIDFKDVEVFPDITIYTLILIAEKDKKKGSIFCVTAKRKQESFLEDIRNNQSKRRLSASAYELFRIDQATLSEKNWNLVPPEHEELMTAIKKNGVPLEDVAEISTGVIGGIDSVFMLRLNEGLKGMAKVTNPIKEEAEIESDLLVPILRGKGVKKWKLTWEGYYNIYPYEEENGITQLIPELKFKANYPHTYEYLEKHKKQLGLRKDSRSNLEDTNKPWYAFVRHKKWSTLNKPKIVYQSLTNTNNFAIDNLSHLWVCGRIYAIVPEKINIKTLLGILNSSILEFYLKVVSPVKAGGYYEYMGNSMKEVPIKIPATKSEKEIEEKIILLVDELQELAKKGHEKGDLIKKFEESVKSFETTPLIKSPLVSKISIESESINDVRKQADKLFINVKDYVEAKDESVIKYIKKYINLYELEDVKGQIGDILKEIPVPKTVSSLSKLIDAFEVIENDHKAAPEEIKKLEEKLNKLVAQLYNIDDSQLNVINNFIK